MNSRKRGGQSNYRVAPADMLRSDYKDLEAKIRLRSRADIEQLILIQSVEGHCHAGYGVFHGKTFPNTGMDDVAAALRLNPERVRRDRQDIIDSIGSLANRVAAGENLEFACENSGEPLTGCGFFRQLRIEPRGLVQGLCLGGMRDERGVRELANQKYGVNMGYCKGYMVDREVMDRLQVDGYTLASKPNAQYMEMYRREGLFADKNDPNAVYQYIRHKTGMGASDDLAIVFAGLMYGFSAAVGCYLADAVDTLEKYAGNNLDQDSLISARIMKLVPDIGITAQDAADLAYLCAIPDEMRGRLPDSSLRHLLEIDRQIDQCALESHLSFVCGSKYTRMDMDHGECTNTELYKYAQDKLNSFRSHR